MVLYQDWSSYDPEKKNRPTCFTKKYIGKISCLKPKGLELRYLVFSIVSWSSTKIVQLMPLCSKLVPTRGHLLCIEIYLGKNFEKSYGLDICCEVLSHGPLPIFFKLCSCDQNWPSARGHLCYIDIYREKLNKIILYKTERPIA